MKNKNKSTKVQQQVKIIQQQEAQKGVNKDVLAKKAERERIDNKKKQEQAKRELEGDLYGGLDLIVQPKVPFGVGASSPSLLFPFVDSTDLFSPSHRPQDRPVRLPQGRQVHQGVRASSLPCSAPAQPAHPSPVHPQLEVQVLARPQRRAQGRKGERLCRPA